MHRSNNQTFQYKDNCFVSRKVDMHFFFRKNSFIRRQGSDLTKI